MRSNKSMLLMWMIVISAPGWRICACAVQRPVVAPPTKPKPITYVVPSKHNYLKLADEAEAMLRKDVLGVWFPRTVDNENGGFHSDFNRDWQPARSQGKFSVFQGRMTWIAAQVAMRRPDLKDQFLHIAQHGVKFLSNVMWDRQYGGFFWGLDDNGRITPFYSDSKHLYGMSFCLYGLAAAHRATHDPEALELAQKAFRWMDGHAHDAKNGGYFEWLTRDGKVVPSEADTGKSSGGSSCWVPDRLQVHEHAHSSTGIVRAAL